MNLRNTFLGTTLSFALCGCGPQVQVGSDAVAQDGWPHYGGNQGHERHATLTKITKGSVANLVPRRVFQLGQVPYAFSASPLVVDGVLYVSASDGVVQAFDLRTGMRKWSFVHKLQQMAVDADAAAVYGVAGPPCCSNQSRGVAYADGTVFLATLDAKMLAIDAETGKKKWEVWGVKPEDNPGNTYGYNSAPVAIGNMVVIGTTGGESPTRHHLTAFDQKTGKQLTQGEERHVQSQVTFTRPSVSLHGGAPDRATQRRSV